MKYLLGMVLALSLMLASATACLASPIFVGDHGFFVYGEYDNLWDFSAGAGFALSDEFALGGSYNFDRDIFGAFAVLDFMPIVLKGEAFFWAPGDVEGYGTALYSFGMDSLTLGLGGGMWFDPFDSDFFLEAAANVAAGDALSLYGSVLYAPSDWTEFNVGVSLGL